MLAAPLAGITDKPYRLLAREAGAALVFTEMVSARGLFHHNNHSDELIDLYGEDHPVGVQIFGSEPEVMAKAAGIAVERGADLVDINMGCPSARIVRNGEGAALMQNFKKARAVMRAVVNEVSVPVTVKMRKGWSGKENRALELARCAADEGVRAVTVHGRTREQFYGGFADWDAIREVVQGTRIPVIGNGDIYTPEDARRMLQETGCAAVMIARGAMGNPWIFSRTIAYLEGREELPPDFRAKLRMARRHLKLMITFKGEKIGIKEMRKHLCWYFKGLPGASRMREKINRLATVKEVEAALEEYAYEFKGKE